MESAGSAVVDFGRFCTGFLVVMGVGMCSPSIGLVELGCGRSYWSICGTVLVLMCVAVYSSSGAAGPLRHDRRSGYGYVDSWRTTDLRNHHKLHDVLP